MKKSLKFHLVAPVKSLLVSESIVNAMHLRSLVLINANAWIVKILSEKK